MRFRHMLMQEIINHFARSEDANERDLADILQRLDTDLFNAKYRIEYLEACSQDCDCGDGVCECGEDCDDHHCSTCTCFG